MIILVLGVLSILLISIGIAFSKRIPERPSQEELISIFKENREIFENVASNFKKIEGEISVDKVSDLDVNISAKIDSKPFSISKEMQNDISKLFNRYGFVRIYKEEDFIYFDKSSGFQWYQAIIYSKSGVEPPVNRTREFTKIENGWFYYYGE